MAESPGTVADLTYRAAMNQLKDLADEIRRIGGKDTLVEEDETYLAELTAKFDELDSHRKKMEREALIERVDVVTKKPLTVTAGDNTPPALDDDPIGEPGSIRTQKFANPWDLSEVRTFGRNAEEVGGELRARALDAVTKMSGANDRTRKAMTEIIERWDTPNGEIARLALLTSSPEYLRAFVKKAFNKGEALTDKERAAFARAMSLTDAAGGFLVPFQLDPTVIITSDGSLNEIRQAARQVVATGDVWNGVSAGATSWSWDAEGAESSDDASTFAQPSIPIFKGVGFVPISEEALMDEQNVAAEVGRLLAEGKETLEAIAFATGTGSGQPTGIVTALTGGASVVPSVTTDVFAIADVYALQSALPAKHRARASWLANNAIYNRVRQFDTAGGAGLWERIGADRPPLLIGKRAYEAEAMDGTITALADNHVLVFGDFQNYVIADRLGVTVRFIPDLFHTANNRPSGQSGWRAIFRAGADSVNDGAFRQLNVT